MRPSLALSLALLFAFSVAAAESHQKLSLERDGHFLVILGDFPGHEIRINYLEAYCRGNSHETDWVTHTVIPHTNQLISFNPERTVLKMRDTLADGLVVDHTITAKNDEVDFRLEVHNPTTRRSEAQWAQPCVRLAAFTGFDPDFSKGDLNDYLPKCFIFLDNQLTRMPTPHWATNGFYVPGQVWCPPHVPRADVNPRPLSDLVPSNGLIGCFSSDDKWVFGTAWEPYQELFQGVGRCLHSDFRLAGVEPGKTLHIHGKVYVMNNNVQALVARYERDFPEHRRK